MDDGMAPEQGLILNTEQGLILIVGCSHPGIVKLAERALELFPNKRIHLIIGGFHLLRESDATVRKIARRLRDLGVEQITPTHCTGEDAMAVFRDIFGSDYLEAGAGQVFRLSRPFPQIRGEYFSQQDPGEKATVFAPGIVSTQHLEHSAPSFSEDGREVYWSRWLRPDKGKPQVIMTTRITGERDQFGGAELDPVYRPG